MNQDWLGFDYVFGTLTPAERAQAKLRAQYDRALAADIAKIESVMAPLALAPEEAAVPASLWDRIDAVIADGEARDAAIMSECFEGGTWATWDAGIEVKPIWDNVSFLVRCAPGAKIAAHYHDLDERMLVLNGSIRIGDEVMSAGDSQFSPAGSLHGEIRSATGCTFFIQRVPKAA